MKYNILVSSFLFLMTVTVSAQTYVGGHFDEKGNWIACEGDFKSSSKFAEIMNTTNNSPLFVSDGSKNLSSQFLQKISSYTSTSSSTLNSDSGYFDKNGNWIAGKANSEASAKLNQIMNTENINPLFAEDSNVSNLSLLTSQPIVLSPQKQTLSAKEQKRLAKIEEEKEKQLAKEREEKEKQERRQKAIEEAVDMEINQYHSTLPIKVAYAVSSSQIYHIDEKCFTLENLEADPVSLHKAASCRRMCRYCKQTKLGKQINNELSK